MDINEFNVNEFDIRGSQNRNPSDTRGLCRPLGDATFAGRRNRGSPHCGRPSTVRRTDSSGRRIDDAAAFPSGRRSLRSHKKVCREESADFWLLRRCQKSADSSRQTFLWLRRDLLPEGNAAASSIRLPEESVRRTVEGRPQCGLPRFLRPANVASPSGRQSPLVSLGFRFWEPRMSNSFTLNTFMFFNPKLIYPAVVHRFRTSAAQGPATNYQPRVESSSLSCIWRTSSPGMASPSSSLASRTAFASSKCVVALTTAFARASGSLDLKMPEPTKTASAPSLRT